MKNKFLKIIISIFTFFVLLINSLPICAEENTRTVSEAQSFIDGIVDYKLSEAGVSNIQEWINETLTKNAGVTSEWYAIALSQSGKYDFSAYETALIKYLSENEVYSASSRQKYALALIGTGSTNQYIYNTLNDSIGKQGVMSFIFGLHMLNNGYSSNEYSLASVKDKLLSLQLADGGWSIMGTTGEVDVTAMAVQALAPYYKTDSNIKKAIDRALTLLSERQMSSGDYSSYGVGNPESTAQVLVALSSLGIDCKNDTRFIKNGNTLFDGIKNYRLSDGTFCHKQGGGYNETATSQVFYSMVSYLRMTEGKTSLYIFDGRNPLGLKVWDSTISKPTETTGSTASLGKSDITDETDGTREQLKDKQSSDELSSESQAQTSDTSKIQERNTEDENNPISDENESTNKTVIENQSETSKISADNEQETTVSNTVSEGNKENTDKDIDSNGEVTRFSANSSGSNYKIWTSLIIAIIAGIICLVMFLTKKRNKKNFLLILVVTAIAVIFVWATDFQTTKSYYENSDIAKENVIGKVTLTIRCDTITDKGDSEFIPEDGVILSETEYEIEKGDTVYDVLKEASIKNKIHFETTGNVSNIYVEGINYIYEFDFGDLSGWVYHVNGKSPSVGCGEYKLSDGDEIEWLYSCELGKDLE